MESTVQNTPPVRPMNEPHTPISEAESNPTPSTPSSGRNTLLTLASLLVLAGIVGITLWLYMQNRMVTSLSKQSDLSNVKDNSSEEDNPKNIKNINGIAVAGNRNQALVQKYGAVCKRFTSLDEALSQKDVACELDLSGQELTELPKAVLELNNLTQLDLSNNKLSQFPTELYKLSLLTLVNLENNEINSVPENISKQLQMLQSLKLKGNNIPAKTVQTLEDIR